MPGTDASSWRISEPRRIDFTDAVTELDIRIVNGTVNVVGTDEPTTRVEIGEVHGPPLRVRREGGKLVVAYRDLSWKSFLDRPDGAVRRRAAQVSVSVPARAGLAVGVVGATTVVSGVSGRTRLRGVSGDTTLVDLAGPVSVETVSGGVEAQRLTGPLRHQTVSGDLTCVDGGSTRIRGDSVSGSMILDLRSGVREPREIRLSSVSGELAIRLPADADTVVDARTAGGPLSSSFDALHLGGGWGDQRVTGVLGAGRGTLHAATVSGGVALLDRPEHPAAAPATPTPAKDL
ncbi:DUF4097 family beta strand repeat-containing protein [Streptomyces sp. NRRL S-1868]|uniref:DUF4097 family beta strand repeat-containing protein n=1 Tax=Streptomyces sp. NRRL S-1868 TaxID=1463892 RepID=UPI00068C6F5E|nr:hypothetical protein [Streptomyces sp. NRRL S-1868]